LYGLWFNLQTVEDGNLESAIQMTEVVEAMNSVNSVINSYNVISLFVHINMYMFVFLF
jgi:hypothetical protein